MASAPLSEPSWRRDGLALALYAALAAWQTGIGLDAGTAFFVGPDPVNDVWSLRWVSANLLERPFELFEANNFFPARDAVLFSEPYLGPAVLVAPLRLVTRNPVLLYNAAVLLVLVSASYGCFLLARRLSGDWRAALLAGIVIPYSAHQTYHLTHLNILTISGFPFLLLGLLRLLERPGPGPALLTSLAFAFEAGTSGYHAFSCAFLCLIVAAWGWRELRRPRTLAFAALAAALGALLLAPFILGFLRVQQVSETARGVAENVYYSVDPGQDLLRSRSLLWRWLLRSPGRPLFPGLVTLGFAGFAIARRRREPHVRLLLMIAGAFLLLSLGPELRWRGASLFPLPFRPLYEHLPFFNAGRHPETYVVPAFLALGLLAALGLQASGVSRRPLLLALVLAVATGESLVRRPKREAREQRLPEVYAWLLAQPRGALLEVPFDEAEHQWWSIFHGLPTVNGQAPFEPREHIALYRRILKEWRRQPAADLESTFSVRLLKQRFPIRYLVVHAYAPEEYRRNLDATPSSFELLHTTAAGDRVYGLRRVEAPGRLPAAPASSIIGIFAPANGARREDLPLDFSLSEEQSLLKTTVRQFAEAELQPHAREWDEKQEFPREVFAKLGEMGLMGVVWPVEYGGSGMTTLDYAIVMEELARVDAGVALSLAAHSSLCSGHIFLAGSEEQKKKYLVPLAKGEKVGCWGLTENSAGSDAGGTKTTATRDGSHWVLNGSKTFITNGRIADTAVIMAVTDKSKGKKGISAFVVERGTPGFRAGKKEDKLGVRSSDTSELVFEDCRVPAGNLLGREGHGFIDTLRILDRGRIGIAAFSLGIAQAALEASMKYAGERRQFGHAIAEFQAIQFKIADMATQVAAARLLTWRAASLRDSGKEHTVESSMAKLFASEISVHVALEAVQIHGGYGYVKEYAVERYLRDSKLGTIGEGTSEVQRLVIARELLHLRGMVR